MFRIKNIMYSELKNRVESTLAGFPPADELIAHFKIV